VVYTSDHGEMGFEHGMVQKHNFFEGSVRVPLIVRGPAPMVAGGACDAPVELLDLLPTFCAAAGIGAPPELEGRSLAPALVGQPLPSDRPVFAEFYMWGFPERMVRQGGWKYMHAKDQPCQLYNLRADPLEQHNLIDRPDVADVQRRLRTLVLDGWEVPDQSTIRGNGAWNQQSAQQAVAWMAEWRRTRRRVKF